MISRKLMNLPRLDLQYPQPAPPLPPSGWWITSLELGRAYLFPFVPAASSRGGRAMLAGDPHANRRRSGLIYWMYRKGQARNRSTRRGFYIDRNIFPEGFTLQKSNWAMTRLATWRR